MEFNKGIITCDCLRKIVLCLLGIILVVQSLNVLCDLGIDMRLVYLAIGVLIFMCGCLIGKCYLRIE